MRNGQKRMRGRNNNHRKSQNPLTRVYESNGPDVKIRGTASHIAEKYIQLARDSQGSGDPVAAENYYQHAEHYFRLIALAKEQFRQQNPYYNNNQQPQQGQNATPAGAADDNFDDDGDDGQPLHGPERAELRTATAATAAAALSAARRAGLSAARPAAELQQPAAAEFPAAQPPAQGNDGDVGGLPSFITGGGGQPQQPNNNPQGGQQNGHDQGDRQDRFGHRRRRRHRGGGYRPDRPDFGNNNPQGAAPQMPNDGGDEPASARITTDALSGSR